ncbi:tetratricopeptide repeat protein [Bacteroides sp. 214]|uniref:tetratricopeptide repeat protein n=1 Tax=Bacteroides sp. 214 TaxID=2302935 RepID=UPI0013D74C73|nr:tetratricopeptide repeat protein [Bacteroides sp. 214]NDW11311.1 tetratricopeptide repeat protein [Bacteroides sp. 214]
MKALEIIKTHIENGEVNKALDELTAYIAVSENEEKDLAYYLLGNAHRKKGDWQQALNNYQYAIDLNPESPAKEARRMVIDILNFYNKDMFNQ